MTHLADYTRLGVNSIVQVGYAQPGINYSLINGNGADPYTGLDQFNRVVDCRWYATPTNTDVARIQHGYDLASNRLWRSDPVARSSGVNQDELYSYDGLNRLSLMQRGQLNSTQTGIVSGTLNFAQAWGLDATGNWGQFWEDDTGTSWNLQQSRTASLFNEITGITGAGWVQPGYDAAGNMVQMPQPASPTSAYSATYDAWNRLISLWSSGSLVQQNGYDGANRRVTKLSSGTTRHYFYSSRWQSLEERLGSSTTYDRQFVCGLRYIDDLVLRDSVTYGRLFNLQDPNWNTIAICDSAGAISERYRYSAYGQPTFLTALFGARSSSSYAWETLYAGYRFDGAVGLHGGRRRWLLFALGIWNAADPLGSLAGDANFFAYTGARAVSSTDPSGLRCYKCWMNKSTTMMGAIGNGFKGDPCCGKFEAQLSADETALCELCAACLDPIACEKDIARIMNAVTMTPLPGFFVGDTFIGVGINTCVRFGVACQANVIDIQRRGAPRTCHSGTTERSDDFSIACARFTEISVSHAVWQTGGTVSPIHYALKINVCGKTAYIDQGALGGADHIFWPGDVPGSWVPAAGLGPPPGDCINQFLDWVGV